MVLAAERLEKPLPKPQRDLLGYASARILEALLEGLIALEFLARGYTRNAAGKAFQAWRALTGALLALEIDVLGKELGSKDKEWLIEKGIPMVPTSRLKPLALTSRESRLYWLPRLYFYCAGSPRLPVL